MKIYAGAGGGGRGEGRLQTMRVFVLESPALRPCEAMLLCIYNLCYTLLVTQGYQCTLGKRGVHQKIE